ncbi:PAS domain-containing protein, partial [Klebsiella pneumoniae]|uniref:PAS domain-containing protein n=1 Tax=Klebsiella pneumoniae TaxID=573 RepID=UPI003566EEFB
TETMPSRDPERQGRWQGWDAEGRPIDVRDFPGARALRGESVLPGTEMLYTEDDGRRVWVRVATVPLMDAERRPQGQITVVHDVDAMKRGAEALRASESRFRSLVEGIPQLVWRAREGGLWTWASPQWTAFTGQSCADSLDMGWLDAVHPEDRDDARALWEKAAASGSLAMAGRLRHAASGRCLLVDLQLGQPRSARGGSTASGYSLRSAWWFTRTITSLMPAPGHGHNGDG